MSVIHDGWRGRGRLATSGGPWLRTWRNVLTLGSLVIAAAACDAIDSLLEVDLPGQVQVFDLNDPVLAGTLVLGAQGDFECAFNSHIWAAGYWTTQLHVASIVRTQNVVALRDQAVRQLSSLGTTGSQPTCRGTNPPALYMPLHTARAQASTAIELIGGWDQAELTANKDFLLGKAHAYRGYAIETLAEAFCELTFDAGPIETREQGFERARADFTTALGLLGNVTSGAEAAEARSVENMALVGRARASLNLGDNAAVLADAVQVPVDFVRYIDRTAASSQTRNGVYDQTRTNSISVTEAYRNLEVGGVPDPRVPVVHIGPGRGPDAVTDIWAQRKYNAWEDDIPFATGREAQLMIAEVEGGQAAVDIINMLRDTHSLPHFSSADAGEIRDQVLEERRRELWLQGTWLGDMLRNDIPFATGQTPKGEQYGAFTCMPLPDREELANPNF